MALKLMIKQLFSSLAACASQLPNSIEFQSMPYGPGGKQQVPSSKRPRHKKGWKYLLYFPWAWCLHTTVPFFSVLPCPGLSQTLGAKLTWQGGPRSTKQPGEPKTRVWQLLPEGFTIISLGCKAGTSFTKPGVGRRIKTRSHVVPHLAKPRGEWWGGWRADQTPACPRCSAWVLPCILFSEWMDHSLKKQGVLGQMKLFSNLNWRSAEFLC